MRSSAVQLPQPKRMELFDLRVDADKVQVQSNPSELNTNLFFSPRLSVVKAHHETEIAKEREILG